MEKINKELLDSVSEKAKVVPRLRMNYNFHLNLDEKVGAFVLSEILVGGNFGQADLRFAKAKDGVLAHAFGKTLHNLMFLRYFPEEVLCEPVFRLYHWLWRKWELWKN